MHREIDSPQIICYSTTSFEVLQFKKEIQDLKTENEMLKIVNNLSDRIIKELEEKIKILEKPLDKKIWI